MVYITVFNCSGINGRGRMEMSKVWQVKLLSGGINLWTFVSQNGFVPNRWRVIIWSNAGIVYWHIYVSRGHDQLSVIPNFLVSGSTLYLLCK